MSRHLVLPLFVLLSACGGKHSGVYEVSQTTGPVDAATALKEQALATWDLRADKAKLVESLAQLEAAHNAAPSDREIAAHLVRGWYFLGDGNESEMPARLAAWDKAIMWGARCLAINADLKAALDGGADEATAAGKATKDDVPCLYWTASALGKWAKASGLAKTVKHLPTVKAYMTRVGELEPTYFYNGPERYWGAYYAAIPSFAGQDLNLSKENFDKSLAGSPNYLGTTVLLAGEWAVKTQNKAVFEEKLNWVLAQDPNSIPEIAAEQAAEQAKARALLAQTNDLFAN